ncbi:MULTISPECIES: IclR family transcriptional regulator [Actinoalloteichus]|uniref:Transcriptional regulator, IclR family n=1 Tax=Actinoalloteichus fjordicus TaxID=1612552 RepID=A0AAC9LEL6_9PSEU|nr:MULTISPECIES: IclR family transcriptional regulator [Actinoalloteichus]APU16246.1 transcriptional regulator, IclR family [Actinoalloteichus fjordicus]APU22306.1 transcriptional regulator, IclR family [Actinoalloteichus sp. GBA129-24]
MHATTGQPRRPDQSGTLERGLAVLEHVGAAEEISTNAIAAQLGLSRSAVYRIVNTLKELGYLEADHVTGRVRLGTRLVQLGVQAMSSVDLHQSAPQFMAPLAEESTETVYLAVPDGDSMVYLAKEQGVRAVTLNCRLGGRRAQHVTSLGKAWLSALPPAERAERVARMDLIRLTPNTIVDRDRLLDELDRTARRGWAIDDIENEPEVGCVAAPVRDRTGRPVAAISIAGPADRVLPRVEELGRAVALAAAGLSRRLGHHLPPGAR